MFDIKEILMKSLKEKTLMDAKFVCPKDDFPGETIIVEAHKTILSLASPVFAVMFSPETEKFTVTKETIEIKDIHAKAFEALIRIIYGETVKPESNLMVVELFYAADKYDISGIKEIAEQFIEQELGNVENIIPIYELCGSYANYQVQKICIKKFKTKTHSILLSTSFLSCQPSTVVRIFSLDKLNINTENSLVKAYIKYLEHNKAAKHKISEALKHIRFLTIPVDDLIRIKFFTEKNLLKIIRIAKFLESEDSMPLKLSSSRESRGHWKKP